MIFDPSDLEHYRVEPREGDNFDSCVGCVVLLLAVLLVALFFWLLSP